MYEERPSFRAQVGVRRGTEAILIHIQKWFVEIGLEEHDWPAQSPDFNPIEHLWDEFERRLQARPKADLTNAHMTEWKPTPSAMF